MGVRKTTIEIDDEVLDKARAALGTETIRETVDAALRNVNQRAALRRLIELVRELDIEDPDAVRRDPSREF